MEEMTALIVAVIVAILAWIFGKKKDQEIAVNSAKIPSRVKQWEPQVIAAANEFNVPASIAMSVLWVESAGNPNARGSAGEYGLMQLKEIAVKDLYLDGYGRFSGWREDPEQNIRAGVAFLALQQQRTGNWFDAVKAYNQGFEGAKRNPEKAQVYLDKVREKEKFF